MLTTPYSDRYTAEILAIEEDAYVLQLNPISDKSSYSKIIVNINKAYGYPNWMQYFDKKGRNFKEAKYRYEKIGKYWNAAEVTMTDLQKNHSTKILLTEIKFDQGLTDDMF
jgi:outer membrane lipoprotein-sorting protein